MRVDPNGTEWWHWLVSGLEFIGGIVLCFVPGMQTVGTTLIGTAVGSIINGYLNQANGGSFNAGWFGGLVAGFLSGIPAVGTVIGGFAGSVVTDSIDSGVNGNEIDWEKAIWSSLIAWGVSAFPTIVGEFLSKNKIIDALSYLAISVNSIIAGIANSIINVYWRGYNGKQTNSAMVAKTHEMRNSLRI